MSSNSPRAGRWSAQPRLLSSTTDPLICVNDPYGLPVTTNSRREDRPVSSDRDRHQVADDPDIELVARILCPE